MSRPWDEYLRLLEESAGLPEAEERGVSGAKAAYDDQARRLQSQFATADREYEELRRRNSRLQVGVRDVVRTVGAALPSTSRLPRLPHSQLDDAMKSAEYDLDQLRKSIDYMRREPQAPEPVASGLSAPLPAVAVPPPTPTRIEASTSGRAPVLIAIGIVLVLVFIALVVFL